MLNQHIALVLETNEVSASELARVSAALQKQVTRDLSPSWSVVATIDAFPRLEDVPAGYWPIIVTAYQLGSQPGLHIDRDGQPYAQIQVSPHWSLDASRACLELLVNPFGDRTLTATSLRSDQGPVEFLVEICGACGDLTYAYTVNEVIVSDFCTPAFYGAAPASHAERYSYNASLRAPLSLVPGGHLTWYDAASSSWWSRNYWGENPVDVQLGALGRNTRTGRELVTRPWRLTAKSRANEAWQARVSATREQSLQASHLRAKRLRGLLERPSGVEHESALNTLQADHAAHDRLTPATTTLPVFREPREARELREAAEVTQLEGVALVDEAADAPSSTSVVEATEAAQVTQLEAAPEVATQKPRLSPLPPPLPATSFAPAAMSLPPRASSRARARKSQAPAATRDRSALAGAVLAVAGLLVVVGGLRLSHSAPAQLPPKKPAAAAHAVAAVTAPQPSPVAAPTAAVVPAEKAAEVAAVTPVTTPEPAPAPAAASAPSASPETHAHARAHHPVPAVAPLAAVTPAQTTAPALKSVAAPKQTVAAVEPHAGSLDDLIDTRN